MRVVTSNCAGGIEDRDEAPRHQVENLLLRARSSAFGAVPVGTMAK